MRLPPSHHPFIDGAFHEINQSFWATPIHGPPEVDMGPAVLASQQ